MSKYSKLKKEILSTQDCPKAINEDTTVYIKLNKKVVVEEVVDKSDTTNEVTGPETADINVVGIVGLIALATVGFGYTIKKRRFN